MKVRCGKFLGRGSSQFQRQEQGQKDSYHGCREVRSLGRRGFEHTVMVSSYLLVFPGHCGSTLRGQGKSLRDRNTPKETMESPGGRRWLYGF